MDDKQKFNDFIAMLYAQQPPNEFSTKELLNGDVEALKALKAKVVPVVEAGGFSKKELLKGDTVSFMEYNTWHEPTAVPREVTEGLNDLLGVTPVGKSFAYGDLLAFYDTVLAKGDTAGHEFHGNQHTGGIGGAPKDPNRYQVSSDRYGSEQSSATASAPSASDKKMPDSAEQPKKWAKEIVAQLEAGEKPNIKPHELGILLDQMRGMGKEHATVDITEVRINGTKLIGADGLGYTRDQMPQIPDEMRQKFFDFLDKQGIGNATEKVDPTTLQPSQKEIAGPHTGDFYHDMDGKIPQDKTILITKDNYVLDGHHHWAASVAVALDDPSQKMSVIRLDANAKELIALGNKFDDINGIARRAIGKSFTTEALLRGQGIYAVVKANDATAPEAQEILSAYDAERPNFKAIYGRHYSLAVDHIGLADALDLKASQERANNNGADTPKSRAYSQAAVINRQASQAHFTAGNNADQNAYSTSKVEGGWEPSVNAQKGNCLYSSKQAAEMSAQADKINKPLL